MAIADTQAPGARVVVLGGGNGTSRLLRGLIPLLQAEKIASLHALVQMADDGGSTGRLRAQYAVGAMGDLSRCMLALSGLREDIRGEKFLAALEYRFADGDFKGHTLRNALMTALELTSDLDSAIATFARVLQIPKYAGVVPTTLTPLTQQVELKGEVLGEGEHFIAHNIEMEGDGLQPGDVKSIFREKDASLNPRAREVLERATHIIIAPGHTYGTILPALASLGIDPSFSLSSLSAKVVVVMTLLTTPGQTERWSGEDFVRVYEGYLGRNVDTVVANTDQPLLELVEGQTWVSFAEKDHPYQLIQSKLVSTEVQHAQVGDSVPRAIVVHDSEKVHDILNPLLV
ncbi:MAG: 2-phospho-L-lactate transferase CofD family protein [Candidatus Andersenbacteria bacterium]